MATLNSSSLKPASLAQSLWSLLILVVFAQTSGVAGEYREADVQDAVKGMSSLDQYERKSAAYKLTEMGAAAASALPVLKTAVASDESMSVRGEAAKALGNIGAAAEPAVPAIIAFLQDPDGGYDRAYAATALGDIARQPETSVPALLQALEKDIEPVVRQLAARALGAFKADAGVAVPALVKALQAGNKDVRDAAADGLSRIPARGRDVEILIPLLKDEIDSARLAACKSLGLCGQEAAKALPALETLTTDANAEVKEAAKAAIKGIKAR